MKPMSETLGKSAGFLQIIKAGDFEAFKKQQTQHAKGCVATGKWTTDEAKRHIAMIEFLWNRIFDDNPPPQAPAFRCSQCNDQGAVEIEGIGVVPCPNPECAVSQQNTRRRYEYWKRRLSHMASAGYYQRLRFDSWDAMEGWKREGKQLPLIAAKYYADAPRQMVSLHTIYEFANMPIPEGLPDQQRNSLVFHGDLGVGKTGLAASIMWTLEARQIPVLMMRTWDMLSQIKDKYFKQSEDETAQDILKIIQEVPVLILDEWNLEKVTDSDAQRMQEIIRHRHGELLPTVITTNLHPSQFGSHWGHRTSDVLLEMAHIIHVSGAKIRETAYEVSEAQ